MRRATAQNAYLSLEQMLAIARAGKAAGCKEALFTLGDKPELRYRAAREELDRLGHPTRRCPIWRRRPARCFAKPACCRTSIPA